MTTALDVRPARPGPRAWGALIGAEMKSVSRDTAGLLVPIALPMLILMVNGFGTAGETVPGTGGLSALDLFIMPITLTMVIAMVGVINLPSFLASYRKSGILKRLAVTPVRPVMVLGAQVIVSAAHIALGIGLAGAVAVLAFGANPPRAPWTALGVLLLAAAAMYGVGMLIAAISPTPNAAVAIGLVGFLLLGAGGGMFGGPGALPPRVEEIGEMLPFGAAVHALTAAWQGAPVDAVHLLALGIAAIAGCAAAARCFRWT